LSKFKVSANLAPMPPPILPILAPTPPPISQSLSPQPPPIRQAPDGPPI
jgi:hypothetical protein